MTIMDTIDGLFMNVAYSYAMFNPVRRIYYNLLITGLSVFICVFIGSIEVFGLAPQEVHWRGAFWNFMANFNINTAGYVIVGLFVVTWLGAAVYWKVGHVEQRWGARLLAEGDAIIEAAEHELEGPPAA